MRAIEDRRAGRTALSFILATWLSAAGAAVAAPLSLDDAQRVAIERDAGREALFEDSRAFRERAVAAGEWPDPEGRIGAVNVPVDSWELDREDMTMLEVGVMQRLPAGRTREFARAALEGRAQGAEAEGAERERLVRLAVERAWRELDYVEESLGLIDAQRRWASALLEGLEAGYAAGAGSQGDLLDATLELLELEERGIDAGRRRDELRAELLRWVGPEALGERLAAAEPAPPPASEERLLEGLSAHPRLAALESSVSAARAEADLTIQRYRPSFGLDVAYGFRSGAGMDGGSRPDMLTAMLTFDIPLFTRDRQDRELAAARAEVRAADARREEVERELRASLQGTYARLLRLADLRRLYEARLAQLSEASGAAALAEYRAGEGSLADVIAMQRRILEIRDRAARARTDYALAHAELRFLTGDAT